MSSSSSSSNNNNENNLDIEEGGRQCQPLLSTSTSTAINANIDVPPSSTDTDQSNQISGVVGSEIVHEDDNSDMLAETASDSAEPPKQNNKVDEQLDDDDNGPEPPAAVPLIQTNKVDEHLNNNDNNSRPDPPEDKDEVKVLPWWKENQIKIIIGVTFMVGVVVAIALGVSLSNKKSPTILPWTGICFEPDDGGRYHYQGTKEVKSQDHQGEEDDHYDLKEGDLEDGILYTAVRSYINQDCAINQQCEIAQVYGWPMNSWCVGNVKDMSRLFYNMETFNEDINGWNTSSVIHMIEMFHGANSFNGDVLNFDTTSVTRMDGMFYDATLFNGDVSNFDTSSVTYMHDMFRYALSFNGSVSNFDTSSVTSMYGMFSGASLFNGDVSNFDTSRVTYMWGMFHSAASFNKDLCSWRDNFPYTNADDIFLNSGCTFQDTPNEAQKGAFCASDCQSSQVVSHIVSLSLYTTCSVSLSLMLVVFSSI